MAHKPYTLSLGFRTGDGRVVLQPPWLTGSRRARKPIKNDWGEFRVLGVLGFYSLGLCRACA